MQVPVLGRRAISLGLFLMAAGCAGHGTHAVPPSGGTIATAVSLSPQSFRPPAMVRTARLPSSVMTSIRTPKSVIAPVGWTQLPGGAVFVSASPDGSLWALSSAGSGADRSIWHYVAGAWANIPGAAMRLAVAPDGTLWVVNSSGGIYSWDGINWTTVAGGGSDISVGADNSVYVISSQDGSRAHRLRQSESRKTELFVAG